MNMQRKFEVRFDPDALKEYEKLDNSVLKIVNKQIDSLEYRADEMGKILENSNSSKLYGCREIKLRDAGLRIIYKITNEKIDILRIVYLLAIERRSRDNVFKIANKRNRELQQLKGNNLADYIAHTPRWEGNQKASNIKKLKKNTVKDD